VWALLEKSEGRCSNNCRGGPLWPPQSATLCFDAGAATDGAAPTVAPLDPTLETTGLNAQRDP
jgi:hypothetical protein